MESIYQKPKKKPHLYKYDGWKTGEKFMVNSYKTEEENISKKKERLSINGWFVNRKEKNDEQ